MQNNFKVGDLAKHPEWDEYLPVTGIRWDEVELTQGDASSWYPASNLIKKENTVQDIKDYDEFKVGDTVWCILHGKGKIDRIINKANYPVEVKFENGGNNYYTKDGRYCDEYPRTLFFSEPKIEAAIKRPFTPTLIGKTVALKHSTYCGIIEVFYEDREAVRSTAGVEYHKSVYTFHEISPVNLLDNA